jgi:hypothetical protein
VLLLAETEVLSRLVLRVERTLLHPEHRAVCQRFAVNVFQPRDHDEVAACPR